MNNQPSALFKAMAHIAYDPYMGKDAVDQMMNTVDAPCEVVETNIPRSVMSPVVRFQRACDRLDMARSSEVPNEARIERMEAIVDDLREEGAKAETAECMRLYDNLMSDIKTMCGRRA